MEKIILHAKICLTHMYLSSVNTASMFYHFSTILLLPATCQKIMGQSAKLFIFIYLFFFAFCLFLFFLTGQKKSQPRTHNSVEKKGASFDKVASSTPEKMTLKVFSCENLTTASVGPLL